MDIERRLIRGIVLAAACVAVGVAIAAWNGLRVIELQEDALLPRLSLSFDARRRYSLAQLVLSNRGGGAAYDVVLEWDDHPLNEGGQPIAFGVHGRIPVLGAGDDSLVLLGESHRYVTANPDRTFRARARSTTATHVSKEGELAASTGHDANALDYIEEAPRTQYELQKIPGALAKIAAELKALRKEDRRA